MWPWLPGGPGEPLSGVEDVFNAIAVRGNAAIGDVMFYGPGAGKPLPTASAAVAGGRRDRRGQAPTEKKRMFWAEGGDDTAVPPDGLESRWPRGSGVQAASRLPGPYRLSRPERRRTSTLVTALRPATCPADGMNDARAPCSVLTERECRSRGGVRASATDRDGCPDLGTYTTMI